MKEPSTTEPLKRRIDRTELARPHKSLTHTHAQHPLKFERNHSKGDDETSEQRTTAMSAVENDEKDKKEWMIGFNPPSF